MQATIAHMMDSGAFGPAGGQGGREQKRFGVVQRGADQAGNEESGRAALYGQLPDTHFGVVWTVYQKGHGKSCATRTDK